MARTMYVLGAFLLGLALVIFLVFLPVIGLFALALGFIVLIALLGLLSVAVARRRTGARPPAPPHPP